MNHLFVRFSILIRCEMLKMAKKNKEKQLKQRHEKQVNIRLFGADLSNYQACGTNPKDVFRSGLYDENRKKQSKREIELKSQIFLVNNRIIDNKLKIQADKLLLKELNKQLLEVQGFSEDKKQWLLSKIEDGFQEFIEDERYDEDVRMDLKQFYAINRDYISNRALQVGKTYEQAVELFDEYLEEMEQQSVLENTRSSEHE